MLLQGSNEKNKHSVVSEAMIFTCDICDSMLLQIRTEEMNLVAPDLLCFLQEI